MGRPFVVCQGWTHTHTHNTHKHKQKHHYWSWFQFVYVWCWEVMIENPGFLNGQFNPFWKVWLLMLAASSEVYIENSTPLTSITPAELHPTGMPNFYRWRHGVGRIQFQHLFDDLHARSFSNAVNNDATRSGESTLLCPSTSWLTDAP